MEDLLNLEYKQQIIIENSCYEVLSMLKFIEGSSYWIEYILKKENDGQMYYLDVEPIGKCALHKMVNEKYNIELEIHYNGKLYVATNKAIKVIEGTTVTTKYGMVKTDHILFICSGAFHLAKPSDMLPELQGRLPIRVELQALTHNDFVRILTEPEANLIEQYVALLGTENFELKFSSEAIEKTADMAVSINENVENIGARRLHTVLEILLEDISFNANGQHPLMNLNIMV